jgi:hypothetical protein
MVDRIGTLKEEKRINYNSIEKNMKMSETGLVGKTKG